MVERYTQQVLNDIETIVDIEFSRLGLVRNTAQRTVVGLCTDGIVAGVVTLDVSGNPSAIVTLQIGESTMGGLPKSDVLAYFMRNRQYAYQSMGQYCQAVKQGLEAGNSGSGSN